MRARRSVSRWFRVQHDAQAERELDAELAEHQEELVEAFGRQGLAPEDAARAARRELGNLTRIREEWRERFNPLAAALSHWRADGRTVRRRLVQRPGAAAGVCLAGALGTGLATAMFALADPFLFRPLPYERPSALVHVSITSTGRPSARAVPRIRDWQSRTDLFDGLATYTIEPGLRLRLPSGTAYVPHASVSSNFFAVLGIPFAPPQSWTPAAQGPTQLLIPDRLAPNWMGRVARTPELSEIGRTVPNYPDSYVALAGRAPAFRFPRAGTVGDGALLSPLGDGPVVPISAPQGVERRVPPSFVGRLRSGVTAMQAHAALAGTMDATAFSVTVMPLSDYMTRNLRPIAGGAIAAGLLILIVCAANVANLLLARAIYRTNESSTRVALGASTWDLVRLQLFESMALATCSCALSLVTASVALAVLSPLMPLNYLSFGAPSLTLRVVVFAGVASCILFLAALGPVLVTCIVRPRGALAQRQSTDTRAVRGLRVALTIAQCAIAVTLLTGAAVLGRSFWNLVGQNTGWQGAAINLSVIYPESLKGAAVQAQIDTTLSELRRLPGVSGAAVAVGAMVNGFETTRTLFFGDTRVETALKLVTPTYFDVTGTPMRRGRTFHESDRLADAVIVNDAFVAKHFLGEPAVGELLSLSRGGLPSTIVGVVGNTMDVALDAAPQPMVFAPLRDPDLALVVSYLVATARSPEDIERAARPLLGKTTPDGVLSDVSEVGALLRLSVKNRTLAALLFQLFAAAAVAVTVTGLAAVIVFLVGRRTREIAIRVAVGARPAQVRRLVASEVVVAAAVGCAIGLLISWNAAGVLTGLVYGIAPADVLSFITAAGVMTALVAAATWVVVRRAVRISPSIALRSE